MKLILARHGETDHNRERVVQSLEKPELTALGVKQARALANYLEHEGIEVMFCSPSKRTMQTMQIIREAINLPADVEPLIVERNAGVWEGRHVDDMIAFRESEGLDRFDFKPEGGESFHDVRKRAELFWKKIMPRYEGMTVLAVGHSLFNSLMIGVIFDMPIKESDRGIQTNASVHEVIIDKGRAKLTKFNYDRHLESLKSPKADSND